MSWKDILKNETPIEDLISDVNSWLDEFLNSELDVQYVFLTYFNTNIRKLIFLETTAKSDTRK